MRILMIVLCLTFAAWAQTAEELVERNLQARGGRARLIQIQALHCQGKLLNGSGESAMEMAYELFLQSPDHYRSQHSLQGMTAISAFDGQEGWRISPFGGRKDPEKVSHEECKSMQWSSDIVGPLMDFQAKGHRLDYLGREDVEGTNTYVLRLTRASGESETHYLDPDTYLEIRYIRKTVVRGVERESETDLGNYALIQGCYFPFSVESGPRGGPKSSRVTWEIIEANPNLEASLFSFPGARP